MLGDIIGESLQAKAARSLTLALESVRKHLGMEVAYIGEFVGNEFVYRHVDAPGFEALIKPGDRRSLDDVYCRHILEGRLPQLMADTADYPLAASLPITKAAPIGAHMSVPLTLPSGETYGMFCCLSPTPNKTLNERDLQVMRMFAEIAADQIGGEIAEERRVAALRARTEATIADGAFKLVFQPIVDFASREIVAFETLCRFAGEPYRSPDVWFKEAAALGLGVDLEFAVLSRAGEAFRALPEEIYLGLNASPETILSGRLEAAMADFPAHRVVVEVTEHAPVADYDELRRALESVRAAGAKLAIDDAGAGFASLQHIIQLKPDLIKLDIGLTRAVDSDPARRALAAALVFFARGTDCVIIAEGIEAAAELETLRLLGIARGQGYFLGRPMELADAVGLVTGRRKAA